jgi:putative hydroxymethylpyrimidine transporter CytX
MSSIAVALLWAGIGVSIAEIWAGSLLGEAGLVWGLVIIVAGHILGGLVLSGAGRIGTRYRVMSMQSTRLVLGNRGSVLPSLLNVLQLVGWATIMLALSGQTGATIGAHFGGVFARKEFWILLIGGGTLAWSLVVGNRGGQLLHSVVIVALLVLTVLLSWVALNPNYFQVSAPFVRPLSARKGLLLMDLVIAMPISWVPLIADYSCLARRERGAFWGSFLGYGLVSTWMYALGLVVFLATGSSDPVSNILVMMGKIGLVLPAILLIFASTVTSDFPDIYSSACSLLNVHPRIKPVYSMWGTGLLTIVLALVFDLSRYESFLIVIGAFFIPLFSILLTEYFVIRRQDLRGVDLQTGRGLEFQKGFNVAALVVWGLGIGSFFLAQKLEFILGGSITSFLFTAGLYWAATCLTKRTPAESLTQLEEPDTAD